MRAWCRVFGARRCAVSSQAQAGPGSSLLLVLDATERLHGSILPLWEDLPAISERRAFIAHSFCRIVRDDVRAQYALLRLGLDVPALTLVRPCFEALVRAIWVKEGAKEEWVAAFLTLTAEAISSSGETQMGPSVGRMLEEISNRCPEFVWRPLRMLKDETWRAMNSYVHGGIRAIGQVNSPENWDQLASAMLNANMMLVIATNLARMTSGVRSPEIAAIQRNHAGALQPPP